jgi:hypothetical protein
MSVRRRTLPTSAQRLADFAARKAGHPDLVAVPERDWEYIVIHPCADESEILDRIGWPAERCVSVDFYWRCGRDVALVQVHARGEPPRERPGIYVRRANNEAYLFNIVAVLGTPVVTTADLRIVKERCVSLGFSGDAFPGEIGPTLAFVAPLRDGAA